MRVILMHNPAAGHLGRPVPTGRELVAAIEAAGHVARYQSTHEPGWHDALREDADLVAVAGGDGAVASVLRRLAGRAVPATILPLGAANNIATAVGLNARPLRLIERWSEFRERAIDVGVASGVRSRGLCFVEAVGGGVFTDLVHGLDNRAPALNAAIERQEGLAGYVRLLREMVARQHAVSWRVELDDVDLSGRYFLVEAMNIGRIGPSLRLARRADPSDGLLDVVLVGESERALLDEFLAARLEDPARVPGLPVRRARRVSLGSGTARLRVDDAVHEPVRPGSIELRLRAGALRLLCPPAPAHPAR